MIRAVSYVLFSFWLAMVVAAIWDGIRRPKPRRFPWFTRRGR
jgi:hypothetical protein